ncbi:hypothetical protein QUA70_00855 [Microcoleus sp. LAD1_D5]|uniref:hypothetical protein n=1 Tax=unclassified Microcoleus TaxID=2642155 RepID=UPI002FD5EFE6
MKNYTAIALLSLLGLSLSGTAALSLESPVEQLETATAQYMLSAQTQQRGERAPRKVRQRRDFMESRTDIQPLQQF